MSVQFRLLTITAIANAIDILEEVVNSKEPHSLSMNRIKNNLMDSMVEIVQSVYDAQETKKERDYLIEFANKKLKQSTWTNRKFKVVDFRVSIDVY